MLLGSSLLPSMIWVGGVDVQLGEVVRRSHRESGLTAEAWNGLPCLEREALLAKTVYAMRAEADSPPAG